jgi:hypothetical protein
LSTYSTKRKKKVFSTIDSDSPVDLYWLGRGNTSTEASKGDKTNMGEYFWDDFLIISKAVYIKNPEADLFDVFNFIRENFLGGWTMLEDSQFVKDIDDQIEREYIRESRHNS